jgi:hypothetical protein
MSENISTKTMSLLDTISLFSNVDKRYKKEINCNMLLLKLTNISGEEHYAIQEFDSITNQSIIRIPSEDEISYLSDMLFLDGTKLCKYDISGDYLKESFEFGDICFVLFSKHIDSRTRTSEAIVNVCGLLFLDILNRRNSTKDIYIRLICSETRSKSENQGLGTKFMNMAETMGKILKCDKVVLSSVDKPLGFYLSKNYKPVKGSSLYEIPEDIKIPIFKRGSVLQSSLPKKALFLNTMGLSTSFADATRLLPQANNNRSTRRTTLRESAGRKYLGNGTIGALSGVKLDFDDSSKMVVMEKILTKDVVLVAEGVKKNRPTNGSQRKVRKGKKGSKKKKYKRVSRNYK